MSKIFKRKYVNRDGDPQMVQILIDYLRHWSNSTVIHITYPSLCTQYDVLFIQQTNTITWGNLFNGMLRKKYGEKFKWHSTLQNYPKWIMENVETLEFYSFLDKLNQQIRSSLHWPFGLLENHSAMNSGIGPFVSKQQDSSWNVASELIQIEHDY